MKVTASLFIRHIDYPHEIIPHMRLQMTQRLSWIDSRLSSAFALSPSVEYLDDRSTDKLWVPDIFISNEKLTKQCTDTRDLVSVYKDGRVLFSSLKSVVLYCDYDEYLSSPDEIKCHMKMSSFGYPAKDLLLSWKDGNALQVSTKAISPKFTAHATTEECTGNRADYSCLKAVITLKRVADVTATEPSTSPYEVDG